MAKAGTKTRRFELVEGASSKFWEIAQGGRSQSVTFGRIGSAGVTKTKTFATADAAAAATAKLIAEKERKGYRERGARPKQTVASMAAVKAASAAKPPTSPVRAFFLERAGIALPDHVFAFWKFWTDLPPSDKGAIRHFLGVEPTFSLFEFFHPTREGELSRLRGDPRAFAWNQDCPPEFFSFLSSGDGPVIYGLWFDEPARAEAFSVRYVRGGELTVVGGTLFDALDDAYARAVTNASYSYGDDDEGLEQARRAIAKGASVRRGLPRGPAPEKNRTTIKGRIPLLSGIGVVSPDAKTVAPRRQKGLSKLQDELRNERATVRAAEEALKSCRAGSPGDALALGHDLIWSGAHKRALPLLKASYEALGRDALASVASARAALTR